MAGYYCSEGGICLVEMKKEREKERGRERKRRYGFAVRRTFNWSTMAPTTTTSQNTKEGTTTTGILNYCDMYVKYVQLFIVTATIT